MAVAGGAGGGGSGDCRHGGQSVRSPGRAEGRGREPEELGEQSCWPWCPSRCLTVPLAIFPSPEVPSLGPSGPWSPPCRRGLPCGRLCRDVHSEQPSGCCGSHLLLASRGSPRPARRALTGPTEQTRQVCALRALDPALNEGRNGADRETEAGHSQEWRVRLGVDMGPGGGLPGHHGWSRTGTGGWVLTPRRGSWH